ncbi:MAG: FAD-dependent oxidoreductase [Bryobacterales bacterium]|nr:FAD-dependent oxidoreductase [Bryobacterales bacterium]
MTRRQLSAALVGLSVKAERRLAGDFVDRSHEAGHRLRDRAVLATPSRVIRTPVLIVGGGMAGLSAAWWLDRHGLHDYLLLDAESSGGGNSRWGESPGGPFPWAAHYIPVPGRGATLVRLLLEELGVLRGGEFEERFLCHSPQERLFLHGRWQDGLEPELGATKADHAEYRRFQQRLDEFAASGEFRIPLAAGARRRLDLDRLTFAAWLKREGFVSPYLHWYADYACRDDYGMRAADTSAWAGIHYFAARRENDGKGPLTWPEGNGWIARRLLDRVGAARLRTGEFVSRIERAGNARWRVTAATAVYEASAVICAAPTYLLPFLLADQPAAVNVPRRTYAPWLTANLWLDRWPAERGLPIAWDNVLYRSPALGYVVSTHQSLRQHQDRTVWTYYWALANQDPAAARRRLLERDWRSWTEDILNDLAQAHPDIRACVTRIDLMRFGHAMARPAPGFLSQTLPRSPLPGLFLANSDISGLSIFEEAQFQGVEAAKACLQRMGVSTAGVGV